MKKTVTVLLCVVLLVGFNVAAQRTENLVQNGTFDTNMDSWSILNSQNMTVNATEGYCNFSTIKTDYWIEGNYSVFVNGTWYNITIGQGGNSVDWATLDGRIELQNTTTNLIKNYMFNSTAGNWTYSESGGTAHIRGNYSTSYNVSAPTSYGIESKKNTTAGSAQAWINQSAAISTNSSIRAEIYYNHWHDPQGGSVRSSFEIDHGTTEVIYNASSSATTGWLQVNKTILAQTGSINTKLWTAHSLNEGNTSWFAKANYWDECYINATNWVTNGTYYSAIINRTYYADWLEGGVDYKKDNYTFTFHTRTGPTPTPDGSWSSWQQMSGARVATNGEPYDEVDGYIQSPNNQYMQYKLELTTNNSWVTPQIYAIILTSVPLNVTTEWGTINQTFTKSYSNTTLLKYDWKIDNLNNTEIGWINISINGSVVGQHNFTYYTTNWATEEYNLSATHSAAGNYTLNISVYTRFNSTNGSATFLFDNVEFLIEKQTPTITAFTATNTTQQITFNGTFEDLTRYENDTFKGLNGIDSVEIEVDGHIITVTNITHLGDGEFEFNYVWLSPDIRLTNNTVNATLTVTDTETLQDTETISVEYPSLGSYLALILFMGLLPVVIIAMVIRSIAKDEKTPRSPGRLWTGAKK